MKKNTNLIGRWQTIKNNPKSDCQLIVCLKKILPSFSKFIFCNSGSEANIKALRIARAITNKSKVVAATGSWHGSVDSLLFQPDNKLKPKFLSDGLSNNDKKKIGKNIINHKKHNSKDNSIHHFRTLSRSTQTH